MKTRFLLVLSVFLLTQISTAQYVAIPDANFRAFLKQSYPNCFNSMDMLDTTCAKVVTDTVIFCRYQNIANLDGIQYFKSLKTLYSGTNKITNIPALPSQLVYFHCEENLLTTLPPLPSTLTYFHCENNKLTSLPNLPNGLTYLHCENNPLTSLPSLPSTLIWLDCKYNRDLMCLPPLPDNLTWLNIANTAITCLPNRPSGITNSLPICVTPCVLGAEFNPEAHLTVSPNPATKNCQVAYNTQGKSSVLTLVDMLGRTVKSVELQGGSDRHEFSVADMPSGLYFLRLNTEGKLLAIGRLVVDAM